MSWLDDLLRQIFGDSIETDPEPQPQPDPPEDGDGSGGDSGGDSGGGGDGGSDNPDPGSGTEPTPDYRSDSLAEVEGKGDYAHVPDPTGGDGQVLKVHYEKDAFRGLNARTYMQDAVGYEPDVAHARYQLYIPESFELINDGIYGGTKLPGMANQRHGGASGGNHNKGASWSGRMFYPCQGGRHDGTDGDEIPLAVQVYDATTDYEYGHHDSWRQGGPSKGQWTTIDYRMELNTPGERDGTITGWVNGEKAFDETDNTYLFRDRAHADAGIRAWRWHFYFGGSWGSPESNTLYARNFKLWVGDNLPEM